MVRSTSLTACMLTVASAVLTGCGVAGSVCTTHQVFTVGPTTAVADHMATPPGDQQQFLATSQAGPAAPGCAVPTSIAVLRPAWTVSDPVNVSISSAADGTNGLATCLGPTTNAVTVTAVGAGTASLTCR